jgi:peptide/nickel transport system substrate-binding protein
MGVAVLLSACTSSPAPAGGTAAPTSIGSTSIVMVQGYLPKAIDPAFDTSLFASATYSYMFDTLVKVDASGTPVADLATAWSNPDPTTWEFKLRSGVSFHNGEPFDAAAAKYTIDRIQDPANKSPWLSRLAPITSVTAPDATTLTLKTARPFAGMPQALTVIFMVPPAYSKQAGVTGFSLAPVGTGPFKFSSFKADDRLVMDANSSYFGGAPKLKQVTIRVMPEESARVAALKSGEAQIVFPVSPDQSASLAQDSRFKTPSVDLGQSLVIILRATTTGPLANKDVRQALNYAIDKQTLSKTLMKGQGRLLDGQLVGPTAFGYNPDVKGYPYDPAKAKQMLAAAGYPNGFTIQFQGPQGRYPNDVQIGQAIADQLTQVGVKTTYEVVEASQFTAIFVAGTFAPLFKFGWNIAPSMSVDQAFSFQVSSSPFKILADPKFDDLYVQQSSELDVAKRKAALQQMAVIFRDDAPAIFLWEIPLTIGIAAGVSGFAARADGTIDLLKILGP